MYLAQFTFYLSCVNLEQTTGPYREEWTFHCFWQCSSHCVVGRGVELLCIHLGKSHWRAVACCWFREKLTLKHRAHVKRHMHMYV